jgi:endonuclease YncB( thermonuclease family)
LVVVLVFGFAWRNGAGWYAVGYAFVVAVGACLATYREDKFSDLGRGLIVTVLLGLLATAVSHRDAVRNAKTSLLLTLSSGKSFTGIDLHDRDLKNAILSHGTLRFTDLHGSGTNLSHADLSYADLSGADLRAARLDDADLTEANLRGARLAGAQLQRAKLDGAHLDGADLREADLRKALLVGTHLQDALLNDADLRGADLNEDFRRTELDGAALKDVRTDSHTKWPDGFDLERAVAQAARPPATKVAVPPDAVEDVVSRVADGDTIELRGLGPVRLLGIDAPSTERPSKERPEETCYGAEAKNAVRELLPPGTSVRYARGNTMKDAFHRKVAYLWLQSGVFVDQRLVASGYATFLPPPRKAELPPVEQFYARRIKRAGIRAAMLKRGLWHACSTPEN